MANFQNYKSLTAALSGNTFDLFYQLFLDIWNLLASPDNGFVFWDLMPDYWSDRFEILVPENRIEVENIVMKLNSFK